MFVAFVVAYPETALVNAVEFTVPEMTWFKRIFESKSEGTSSKEAKPLFVKKRSNAKLFGANKVYSPPTSKLPKFPSAKPKAVTRLLKSGSLTAISKMFFDSSIKGESLLSSLQDSTVKKVKSKSIILDNLNKFFMSFISVNISTPVAPNALYFNRMSFYL